MRCEFEEEHRNVSLSMKNCQQKKVENHGSGMFFTEFLTERGKKAGDAKKAYDTKVQSCNFFVEVSLQRKWKHAFSLLHLHPESISIPFCIAIKTKTTRFTFDQTCTEWNVTRRRQTWRQQEITLSHFTIFCMSLHPVSWSECQCVHHFFFFFEQFHFLGQHTSQVSTRESKCYFMNPW